MNFFRGVMGGQTAGPQPSGAETIQKLCDRVASSTLLEDRRDAKYRLEVGTQAMNHLVQILLTDRSDSEIIGYALDTLFNIICNDEEEEQDAASVGKLKAVAVPDENPQKQTDDLGVQFTDQFIQDPENITLLLTMLEEFDFHVRWPGVKLLTILLKNQCAQVQGIILVSPMGVSRLMDLLADSREVIRNDGLLLLQQLTKSNAAIQKIVAFENAFERLLDIITEEGSSDGGIVLCTILMATGVPADILTETINTVSEVIRGSQINQDYFASVNAPSNPPRPAIVVLLMSMVNERQPFVLRCAVLYCFQCFLYRNLKGQGEIVATLLPSTIDANSISAGQLLCGGLFSADSLSNWCAAVALAHALQDNLTQKEQLLRVQLATSLGKPPVSLLQQCTNILSQGSKVQTRVGLLMLLCTWISNCPIAVTHFLHNQENVPFLTGQISENLGEDERLVQGLCALLLGICIYHNDNSLENYTKEKLKQLIEKRIGKENFVEKLSFITKHELYSRAAQKPQPVFPSPEQMLFDHEELTQGTLTQQLSQIQQHKDQYNLLKLKLGKDSQSQGQASSQQPDGSQVNGLQAEELSQLREEVEELRRQQAQRHTQLEDKDALIATLRSSESSAQTTGDPTATTDDAEVIQDLRAQVQTQQTEISQLQTERDDLMRRAEAKVDDDDDLRDQTDDDYDDEEEDEDKDD
ncbi:hypothetical protein CRUP_038847 [Coryphaenoides rupestris]|nr:hypothetical protein CRUP_038847 [Coryphaenoides rupestris]